MASDNVTLNAGAGGATVRTLADASNEEWPASVIAYATTVLAGANVLQVVTPAYGLPISGSVTANAGTNLNTALLAVESGGHLASLDTKSPALGQALAAASVPVVMTAAQLSALTPLTTLPTVTTVATVSALTGITNALPAGTNLLGKVAAAQQVGILYNGTTPVTPAYAQITASAAGATTIVAGVAGQKVYVLRWNVTANGAVNVNLQSHTTTANATGLHYLTQYASAGSAYCPAGIFATTAGEGLDINLSGAQAVGGELTYVQF